MVSMDGLSMRIHYGYAVVFIARKSNPVELLYALRASMVRSHIGGKLGQKPCHASLTSLPPAAGWNGARLLESSYDIRRLQTDRKRHSEQNHGRHDKERIFRSSGQK